MMGNEHASFDINPTAWKIMPLEQHTGCTQEEYEKQRKDVY